MSLAPISYNPIRWCASALQALLNPEGRRAWAVMIAFGCGVVMVCIAVSALWLIRKEAPYVFWLGTEAMGVNLIVITAFTGLLVKRDIGGSVNVSTGAASLSIDEDDTGKAPDDAATS